MSRMKPQPAPTITIIPAITWPDLTVPESPSAVKGMTDEQRSVFNEWYTGLKTSVNANNSAQQTLLNNLQTRISALEAAAKTVAT